MKHALRFLAQGLLYLPLMALLGVFSTHPRFDVMPASHAVVRLSLSHAGERVVECRERSAAELAKLPPNMRAQLDCPRERAPVRVEITLDGQPLFDVTAPPTGLRKDGASTIYRRAVVAAGRYRVVARLADAATGEFRTAQTLDLDLAAGGTLLIDYSAAKGGFVFRS